MVMNINDIAECLQYDHHQCLVALMLCSLHSLSVYFVYMVSALIFLLLSILLCD